MEMPSMEAPAMEMPSMEAPAMEMPSMEAMPSMEMPSMEAPMPDMSMESVEAMPMQAEIVMDMDMGFRRRRLAAVGVKKADVYYAAIISSSKGAKFAVDLKFSDPLAVKNAKVNFTLTGKNGFKANMGVALPKQFASGAAAKTSAMFSNIICYMFGFNMLLTVVFWTYGWSLYNTMQLIATLSVLGMPMAPVLIPTVIVFTLFAHMVVKALSKVENEFVNKIAEALHKTIIFRFIIRAVLATFVQISIMAFTGFYKSSSITTIVPTLQAASCSVLVLCFAAFLFAMLTPRAVIESVEFKKYFGALYDGIKTNAGRA